MQQVIVELLDSRGGDLQSIAPLFTAAFPGT